MTAYIALLRGVNVGGRKPVPMADLRALAGALGLDGAQTLLQSGNLVFEGSRRATNRLETLLEGGCARTLGLETVVMVRSGAEWAEIVAGNPFREMARRDPAHLHVVCFKRAPTSAAYTALAASIRGREELRPAGRHAYVTYPDGAGTSKFTNAVIERVLDTRGTARNWNTVLKLAALTGG